jgi:hypothetical protein
MIFLVKDSHQGEEKRGNLKIMRNSEPKSTRMESTTNLFASMKVAG